MKNPVQKSLLALALVAVSGIGVAKPMNLYCQGNYATGELLQLVITIDLQTEQLHTGNRSVPIGVDEFNIIWRSEANGVQFESVLNRWTGELTATMIEPSDIKPNFLRGLCQKIENRKF